LFRAGSRIARLATKTTEDRRVVFVTSFHFTDPRKAQRVLRNNSILFGTVSDLTG
jgi:hypothetical protein